MQTENYNEESTVAVVTTKKYMETRGEQKNGKEKHRKLLLKFS